MADFKGKGVAELIARVKSVGRRLITAQPKEMVVGNVIRRVLGLIREIAEDKTEPDGFPFETEGRSQTKLQNDSFSTQQPQLGIQALSPLTYSSPEHVGSNTTTSTDSDSKEISQQRPSLLSSQSSFAFPPNQISASLLGLLSHPDSDLAASTQVNTEVQHTEKRELQVSAALSLSPKVKQDLKADVIEGIRELLDELDQTDDLIATYALDHIHSNEIILTHASSMTVQKFLLAAARKRKFTVVHVEAYPNDHEEAHNMMLNGQRKTKEEAGADDERFRPLTAAGITVILIPDSAIFAIMSRVNKVILATRSVLANGGLVAAAGARIIAKAAKEHHTPVVVLSGIYKLSPVYPFDTEELIDYGNSNKIIDYGDGDLVKDVEVINPLSDYVPADLVDLYITNL